MIDFDTCMGIVKSNPVFRHKAEKSFLKREYPLTVHMFSYRFASALDFYNLGDVGLEMRGVAFVESERNPAWRTTPFLGLKKFFNVNENDYNKAQDLDKLSVIEASEKLDGTLIHFWAPSLTCVNDIQPRTNMDINWPGLRDVRKVTNYLDIAHRFVPLCWLNGYFPYFEFTSPSNRIVMQYSEPRLTLIKLREISTGRFVALRDMPDFLMTAVITYKIPTPKIPSRGNFFNCRVSDYLEEAKDMVNFEGWVLHLENDKIVKVKTPWYFEQHHLSENFRQEHELVASILNGSYDDIVSNITNEEDKLWGNKIALKLDAYLVNTSFKILRLVISKPRYQDRAEFYQSVREYPFVPVIMGNLTRWENELAVNPDAELHKDWLYDDILDDLKLFVRKKCTKLEAARKFLKDNSICE